MGLWQRIKNAIKLANFKHATPFTLAALKRKSGEAATGNRETVGAVHRFDVTARGFFKRRTVFKDKFFRCAITRYFILQFGAFCFAVGQFFLGRFLSISEYLDLILEQGNSFTQDGVAFNAGKNIKRCFDGSVNGRNIHDQARFDVDELNSKQNGDLGQ